jgi:hypothetical protein
LPSQDYKNGADEKQLVPDPQYVGAQKQTEDSFRIRNRRPVPVDTVIHHVRREQCIAHDDDGHQVPFLCPRPRVSGQHRKPDNVVFEHESRNKVGNPHGQDHGRPHDEHVLRADIGSDRNKTDRHKTCRDEAQVAQESPVDETCQQ